MSDQKPKSVEEAASDLISYIRDKHKHVHPDEPFEWRCPYMKALVDAVESHSSALRACGEVSGAD